MSRKGDQLSSESSNSRDFDRDPTEELPLSFVVCVSDAAVLASNLMASPCLGSDSPHEVIAVENPPNAATALNAGLERARHGLVVCVHQDVYLPPGWDRILVQRYRQAEGSSGRSASRGSTGSAT